MSSTRSTDDIFVVSETWQAAYPGASAGLLLIRGTTNAEQVAALEERKSELVTRLQAEYGARTRAELRALPVIAAYDAYYRRFGKTYHVLLQLESVANKGKSIPRRSALVDAMFIAELGSLLLTAGHDLATLALPVRLDVATGDETYTTLGGQEQELKPGDMFMADAEGVISSILSGPDQRTRINAGTRDVLYTVYAPAGIPAETVRAHLHNLADTVRLAADDARVEALQVFTAPSRDSKSGDPS